MAGKSKSDRKKYGVLRVPLVGTSILFRPLPHFIEKGIQAFALLVLNLRTGTFVSANVYDECLGKGYDPSEITHPLPADGDEKYKDWRRRGYELAAKGQTFGVVTIIDAESGESDEAEVEVDEPANADA